MFCFQFPFWAQALPRHLTPHALSSSRPQDTAYFPSHNAEQALVFAFHKSDELHTHTAMVALEVALERGALYVRIKVAENKDCCHAVGVQDAREGLEAMHLLADRVCAIYYFF